MSDIVPDGWAICVSPEIPKGYERVPEGESLRLGDCFWTGQRFASFSPRRLLVQWKLMNLGEVFVRPLDQGIPVVAWMRRRFQLKKHLAGLKQPQLVQDYHYALGSGDTQLTEAFLAELKMRGLIA